MAGYAPGFAALFSGAATVTPSDSVAFVAPATALYIGGTGNVTLVTQTGVAVAFNGLPAGSILPVYCTQVKATGTTATGIVALS